MKKIGNIIGRIFRHVGLFFDKWLITPITKLILKLMELNKNYMNYRKRLFMKKLRKSKI